MYGTFTIKNLLKDLNKNYSIFMFLNFPLKQKHDFLEKLHVQYLNDEITIQCNCNKNNPVPMKVTKINDIYVLESELGYQSKHYKKCFFSASVKEKNVFEKAWDMEIMENDLSYVAKLGNPYFTKKKYEKLKEDIYEENFLLDVDSLLTFRGFVAKFNIVSWEMFLNEKERLPNDIEEFMRFSVGVAKRFYPDKKKAKNLNSYFLPSKNRFRQIPKNSKKFFYGELKSLKKIKHENLYLTDYDLKIYNPYIGEYFELHVDGLTFQEALKRNKIMPGKDNSTLVSGIVTFNQYGEYILETFELFPISKKGLIGFTKEEIVICNNLIDNKRLFKKEHLSVPEYQYELPLITFLDTKKMTIGDYRLTSEKEDAIKKLPNYVDFTDLSIFLKEV